VAGILDVDDAARVICHRSALLRRIRGLGAMAVVDLSVDDAREAIRGFEDRVAVAVSNSPASTVLSGDPDVLDHVMALLESREVFCRKVKVDVASHSPQVDVLRDDLIAVLHGLAPRPATTPFLSTVTGTYEDGPALDAEYWAANLRQLVHFAAATRRLLEDGHGRFVELSPHPVLLTAIGDTACDSSRTASMFASTYRDADEPLAMRHALGALYADGYDVDWRALHPAPFRPVDLPLYPWQREHYWMQAADAPAASRRGRRVHPLLGWEQPVADPTARVWENELDARRGAGTPTAIVETLLAAAEAVGCRSVVNVRIEQPMLLTDEPLAVQTIAHPGRGDDTALGVFSRTGEGWTRHASAGLGPDAASPVDVAPFDAGRTTVTDVAFGGDDPVYPVDACLQAAARAVAGDDQRPLSVVGARSVQMHHAPGGAMRCSVTVVADAGSDVTTADVALVGGDGDLVVTIAGLRLQPAERAAERLDDRFYGVEWYPRPVTEPTRPLPPTWLVFADEAGTGHALAAALADGGAQCTVVTPGSLPMEADYDRVVGAGAGELGVAYLWGLHAGPIERLDELEQITDQACGGLLRLVQALARSGRRARVHVVTSGAQPVAPAAASAVAQAPLWGLARSLAEEMPELYGSAIDLDPSAPPAVAAGALAGELAGTDGESEVVLRDGARHVARLVRVPVPASDAPAVRPDASYLVTGGFGVLGSEVARWLVGHGARRLILAGRTALPDRKEWARLDPDSSQGTRVALVRELERRGAAVHVASVDVGNEAALRGYLDAFEADGFPPIRGVVHAAAVLERHLLDDLDPDELWAQVRPKVAGAWLLSELLGELDFFVLFSSIAALLPQPGQGAYVASNAFLDALAHWRARRGEAALSVNWGIWAGTGGLLGERWQRQLEHMEAQGFRDFRVDQGLDALGRMLSSPAPQVVFASVDWGRYSSSRPPSAFVADLVSESHGEAGRSARTASLTEWLAAAPPEDRHDVAEATVRRVAARVLRLPETQIDVRQPLGELGLDSMMGLELHNRLEAEVGRKLSATLAWNHPAVADIAAFLLAKLGFTDDPELAAETRVDAAEAGAFADLVATADALDDDETIQALMGGVTQ
jgi:myxalamid-type polyketide synthase MxaE and MxaD